MIDFLDQLEDELRVAAERRGQPRRRRPTGALKALAAGAVLALLVVGGARLAGGGDERAASPTPTPTPPPGTGAGVVYATAGEPAFLELLSARLRGFHWTDIPDGPSTADPSLGSVVLYRPHAEERAQMLAFDGPFEAVRPLTEADERLIHVDVSGAEVVVVYGLETEQRMLQDPDVCKPAGGELKLCVDRSDEQRYSVFVLGDEPLAVEPLERGWWSWAATSPDGRTILASWTGYDCKDSRAAFIRDGHPQALAARSRALGWTTNGRAIVSVPEGCSAEAPGTYLVSADGEHVRIEPKQPLEPSLRPLDLEG